MFLTRIAMTSLVALLWAAAPGAAAQGLPHTFLPDTPALAEEVNDNFRYIAPKNIVYVRGDKSPEENGAALLAAVDRDNLTAIAGAPSADNPYLIRVGPGVYRLPETLRLHNYIHLQGAGREATRFVPDPSLSTAMHVQYAFARGFHLDLSNPLVDFTGISLRNQAHLSDVTIYSNKFGIQNVTAIRIWTEGGVGRVFVESTEIFMTAWPGPVTGIQIEGNSRTFLRDLNLHFEGLPREIIGINDVTQSSGSTHASNVFVRVASSVQDGSVQGLTGIHAGGAGFSEYSNCHVSINGFKPEVSYPLVLSGGGEFIFKDGALLQERNGGYSILAKAGNKMVGIVTSRLSSSFYEWESGSMQVECIYSYLDDLARFNNCQGTLK